MESVTSQEVRVLLRSVMVAVQPDGLSPVLCLNCGRPLDVHQPDADLPYRMLATCDTCKGWHLVECDLDMPRAILTLLPDARFRGEGFSPFGD